jgi:hypothetical protein
MSPDPRSLDASPGGEYILKVILTPTEVIERIRDNTDSEPLPAAPDPKKPFYGHVSDSEFCVQSKQLDQPKSPSPWLVGRVSPCADGCEILFAPRDLAHSLGILAVGTIWAFIAGIAVAYCVTSDTESGTGYFLFSGIFGVGALALRLAACENREQIKIEFVTLFENEAFRRPLRDRERIFPPTRSEVVSAMLRKLGPSRSQLLRTIRTGLLTSLFTPGIPFLGGFFYAWPALRQLHAELEALHALKATDVEAVVIYRDAHAEVPLTTVTDEARLQELFGKFDRIERAAKCRPSDYTTSFRAVFRYRDGSSQNWEIRLKGTSDDGLYMNRPVGEELSSFRLSGSYYRVPQLRNCLENVTDGKR